MVRPRLCVIGPLVGRHAGRVTTQGERLADLFEARGHKVIAVSDRRNRYGRALDIARTLVVRRHDFDLAVLQVFSGPSFVVEDVASRLLSALGKPTVMVLRGGGMPAFASDRPVWTRRVLRRASAIVTPSPFLARAMRPLGFDAQVIPNVISLDQYRYRKRRDIQPRFLWMRAFHEIYNPALALRAFAQIRAAFPGATLTMAGSDLGTQADTQRLAESLQIADAVTFPGFLAPDQKASAFEAADVYLSSNRIDNTPVSVIESCAAGVPVIATRVGGISDLLTSGETGILVPDGDADAMARAAVRLLSDPDLVERLSVTGRAFAAHSEALTVMPKWDALLARVAGSAAA